MTARAVSPIPRLRRLRRTPAIREWISETQVEVQRLIFPMFVHSATGPPEPVPSLPGVERYSVTDIVAAAAGAFEEGIRSVLLFGRARRKDAQGRDAWSPGSAVARAVKGIKARCPELVVMTDVCLCSYTTHGHCGIVRDGTVDNDATVPLLARTAVAHAHAGADFLAPSAMMDGQVAAIRNALDGEGFSDRGILAYAAKFASSFYGPFREAADSAPAFGDRRGYQLDPRDARGALRELAQDLEEGADIVMIKPALPYLDVLARARERFDAPLAAYQVSGEYALLKAGAERQWIDERPAVDETIVAFRRAGADLIVTYYAQEIARWSRTPG